MLRLSFLSFAVGFSFLRLFSFLLPYLIFSCRVVLGEIAPPTLRGTLGTCTQFAIVIGILFSNIIALPLATSTGWRYMFAVGPLLSIVQIVFSPYMVESPRWLLSHDEKSTEARIVIKKLRAFRSSKGKFIDHVLFDGSYLSYYLNIVCFRAFCCPFSCFMCFAALGVLSVDFVSRFRFYLSPSVILFSCYFFVSLAQIRLSSS
jgi:hypothetical protein